MISKEPSQLFFDSDVLQAISIKMCLQCLKKDAKQKVEEDLYVIDQNLGDSNYLLSQIKKHNSWSTYLTLLRSLNYASYSKYASVFQFEDPSDSIFIILKGSVSILLPDIGFENIRQDTEIKQKAAQQLRQLGQKFPQLDCALRKLPQYQANNTNNAADNGSSKPTNILLNSHKNTNINQFGITETNKEFKNTPTVPTNTSNSPTTSNTIPSNQLQHQQQQQLPWGTDAHILKLLYPGLALSRTLEAGDYFGEIGVQFNVPRSAAVVCLTDCEFAILPATAYSALRNKRLFDEDKLYSRLRNLNAMFKSLAKDKLSLFSRHFQSCSYPQGEVIFDYGDSSEWIYFLEHGEILIHQRFHSLDVRAPSSEYRVNNNAYVVNSNSSNQATLNDLTYLSLGVGVLTDGSYFGEDGVFFQRKDMKRTTRAVAKEQSLVLKISSEYFYSNFKSLIETDILSIAKIRERIIKQKLEDGDDGNDGEDGFDIDGPESTTGNKNQHHFLHEHAKQSSKSKQPAQIEDDFLNARNLKSDLFVLYEQNKCKLLGIAESMMEKNNNNSSSELICSDEYLYPKYDISLNPGLFMKRCFRQTAGTKNRLMRQSRRSSTQFLAASVSEKIPAASVNSSCQEIHIKSCKLIRTAQSSKLINLPFSSAIDSSSLNQQVCSPITKKTHKLLSQIDSYASPSTSKYTTPNIHSYYAPNKTYSSIIPKGSSSHIAEDNSNNNNDNIIPTTNKYFPKQFQYKHTSTLSPQPKGFQSQSFIQGSTLVQFPIAQKSTKDSLSFIPDISLMQSQQLAPIVSPQQRKPQQPFHKKTKSQMTINSYYFQQFQQPQQQQTYQITKSIREIQQEQLKQSSTQEIQPIQNNKQEASSQQYLPPSISNIPQIQLFSKQKSAVNSDGKQTHSDARSSSVVRSSAGNQRRSKDTSLHVQSVSSISSNNNNNNFAGGLQNKRQDERNISRNTNRMNSMDEQLSGLECHEKINENDYDFIIPKQPIEKIPAKEKYGIDSRDMVRNKLRFLYESQDQPSQSSFSSTSYNNHCRLGVSLSTFSSSILPKNITTQNKSKLKLSTTAESQLALMASLRRKLADVSTYQAQLKQEGEEDGGESARASQSVHENKRNKNLFQYNLTDSYSAFLHPKDTNALLNKLSSFVQSK